MSITTPHGSPQFPRTTGNIQPSTQETIDDAVQALQANKQNWVTRSIQNRISIIDTIINNFVAIAPQWVASACQAKGIAEDSSLVGEEWMIGTWPILKYLRQLRQSLLDIETYGRPRIPGPVTTQPNGQVSAQVFPQTFYDRLFFRGVTAEIWMEPGVSAETLPQTQALIYQNKNHTGKVALVLGAGNVSSIAPTDLLYKLFVEDQVVLLKMNPVNAYLGPLIEESFRPLIEQHFLRVIYGGIQEGEYLCNHPGIEEIHITGSDKTFDAIVFGTGQEGTIRKAEGKPLLTKPITGELGNVSPIIIVPGPWTSGELAYQAEQIVSTLTTNAGFNCNATRVIIQHADWNQRGQLLQQIRTLMSNTPTRNAYYPGARERQQSFLQAHPEAEQLGTPGPQQLPWTLIAGVDPANTDDICFTTEAFCGLFAETSLEAASVAEYIDRAVTFANEQLWGTLNATLIVHPESMKVPAIAIAVERAITNLHYGTIGLNYWAGGSFAIGITTWGAFPGHTLQNIQSGNGVVHNALMFSRPQKCVLRAPFTVTPTPPWFITHSAAMNKLFPRLTDFEASPSIWKVPGIIGAALTNKKS
jgi:acyl-CoA reductase-like NAD-dependent aldehyde dehydrogenase